MSPRKQIIFDKLDQVPQSVISQGTMLWNKTGSWRYMRPGYRQLTPPCNNGCPAGNDIEGFIKLVQEKDYPAALKLIKEENPLTAVCGRVCFHPCEKVCNRKDFDNAIAINLIERFIWEKAKNSFKPEKICSDTYKKVAIAGSGPAGLTCAYHLARLGHKVTIFEALDKPGGILRYGIPKYRLPKHILDREINDIQSLGVKIKCNKRVGKDISFEELDSYDAVFIGTGCHKERKLFDVKHDTKGHFPSLKYLTLSEKDKIKGFGKRTAVIGGGNSAIDAARTALRHGSRVTLFYHRSKEEMPGFEEEVLDAQKEGVDFQFLVQPVDIVVKRGKVKEVKLRKTILGKPDESGRRIPEPVLGSDFSFKADCVIPAIGEKADFDILPAKLMNDGKKLKIDEFGRTNIDKIFAGGDTALDDHNIAAAIGSGKASALAIDSYLSGKDISEIKDDIFIGNSSGVSALKYNNLKNNLSAPRVLREVVEYKDINNAYFNRQSRVKKEKLEIAKRSKSFEEVCKTLSLEAVSSEAQRCFHCGVCTLCDNCLKFCPDVSVIKRKDGSGYDIDLDYCKGCGVCVNECPRSAMFMEEDI